MVISNRDLAAGTILVARYKGQEHRVLVLGDEEVGMGYELDGGTIYKSLSSAGSAVMGGVSCNGWRFWTVEGEEPTREPKPAKERKARAKSSSTVVQLRKVPNQRGVAEGSTKWFCSACMKSFLVEGTAEPAQCPDGHAREVKDDLAPEGVEAPAE